MAKPKERTLKRPEEALPPERINLGTGGEIISEWWAISNRNRGRINLGMVGDFARNHHEAQLLRERRLTASERWRLERLERAVLPRNIAPEMRESLVFALRGKAKSLCMLVIAESEAVIFAQHLAALFNEAGIATQISLLSKDSKQEGVAMWTVDSVGSEIARVLWQVARIGGGQISGQRPIGLEALPLDKNCLVVGRNDAALMPANGQPGEGIDERGNPVPAP